MRKKRKVKKLIVAYIEGRCPYCFKLYDWNKYEKCPYCKRELTAYEDIFIFEIGDIVCPKKIKELG